MGVTIYRDLEQGSDEWLAARCGILTASEMKLILTPTLKLASNDKERQHLYELLAQRVTQYVEPQYVSDAMLRGHMDEIEARRLYAERFGPVEEVGFITRDDWGFTIGYSPDGLVGDDGLIEIKSRAQKYQVQTIIEGGAPDEYMLQIQTGLLVTDRKWLDFISYSGGLPMHVARIYPDDEIQTAIIDAATAFEERLEERLAQYRANTSDPFTIQTERREMEEITL